MNGHELPGMRDRESRIALLSTMSVVHGSTEKQLAAATGKAKATIGQMLAALELDGCVRRAVKAWYRTQKPLPAVPTSTARINDERCTHRGNDKCFDFSELMAAWPYTAPHPPAPLGPIPTHRVYE